MKSDDAIPASVLAESVVGVDLVPGTLRDQLGAGPTLVVFLRQLGCLFCRERVGKLRAAGFEQGERLGDVFMMPGVFWVEGDRVRWAHVFRHAGDTPDFTCIPELVGG